MSSSRTLLDPKVISHPVQTMPLELLLLTFLPFWSCPCFSSRCIIAVEGKELWTFDFRGSLVKRKKNELQGTPRVRRDPAHHVNDDIKDTRLNLFSFKWELSRFSFRFFSPQKILFFFLSTWKASRQMGRSGVTAGPSCCWNIRGVSLRDLDLFSIEAT